MKNRLPIHYIKSMKLESSFIGSLKNKPVKGVGMGWGEVRKCQSAQKAD